MFKNEFVKEIPLTTSCAKVIEWQPEKFNFQGTNTLTKLLRNWDPTWKALHKNRCRSQDAELPLGNSILDPVVPHVKILERFIQTWAMIKSWTVELPVSLGVPRLGCGWPNSVKVWRMGTHSCAPRKIPPVSSSRSKDGTPWISWWGC